MTAKAGTEKYQIYRLYEASINPGASPLQFYYCIDRQIPNTQLFQDYTATPVT